MSKSEIQRCGCGGEVRQGIGCLTYGGSDDHIQDAQHEDFMRRGGLGFGVYHDSFDAMMSMHLQNNGFDFEQASALLEKKKGES